MRIALALAWEAVHSACDGQAARRRTERLIQAADRLAQSIGHPHAVGMVALSAGFIEFLEGRFRPALERLDHAATILREQCAGVIWELDTAHIFGLWSLFCLGRQGELRSRFQLLNREAHERAATATWRQPPAPASNRWPGWRPTRSERPAAGGRGRPALVAAAVPHPAHEPAQRAPRHRPLRWGRGDRLCRLCETRPALEASLLLRIQLVRIDVLHFSGRCAVAAAAVADNPRALLRAAEGYARRLDRQRAAWASAMALLIRAGAAAVRGDAAGAVARLTAAVAAYDAVDMGLYAASAPPTGRALGRRGGPRLIAQADAWMTGQGISNPGAWPRASRPASPIDRRRVGHGDVSLSSTSALYRSPIAQKNLENSAISTFFEHPRFPWGFQKPGLLLVESLENKAFCALQKREKVELRIVLTVASRRPGSSLRHTSRHIA